MSVNFELYATTRESRGTTASRKSRRDGQVPAMVYGAGKQNQQLFLDSNEISHSLAIEAFHSAIISLNTKDGPEQVILREVQMHPYRPIVMHVDFQRVKSSEKLHMKVPIHFEGADQSPGVKMDGGILSYQMTEFDITCLPKNLPEFIAIDVSALSINESIHLADIQLPEGVEFTSTSIHEGDNPTVATITAPKIVAEDEESVAEGDALVGEDDEQGRDDKSPESGDTATSTPDGAGD